MAKVRICRAVESNVGERRAYKKQLVKLQRDFNTFVLNEIFLALESQNALTVDSKLSPDDRQKEILKALKGKTLKGKATALFEWIYDFVGRNLKRWLDLLADASRGVVDRFVKKAMASTSNAQKAALKAAGVKPSIFTDRWTVSVVGKQTVSPEAARLMPDFIKQNVSLITKIGESDVSRIADTLIKGLEEGMDYNKLRSELMATSGFDGARADRVALDQINKINQQVQILNAQSLGCTHARWKHVPGQYTSRLSHMKMDGREFNLAEGMYDETVGYNVIPGQLPYCRCVSRLLIPNEVLND